MRVDFTGSPSSTEIDCSALPADLTVHPASNRRHGPTQWVEFLTAGDYEFLTASGEAGEYNGVEAGDSYGVQITRITAAPAGARVRVGWAE